MNSEKSTSLMLGDIFKKSARTRTIYIGLVLILMKAPILSPNCEMLTYLASLAYDLGIILLFIVPTALISLRLAEKIENSQRSMLKDAEDRRLASNRIPLETAIDSGKINCPDRSISTIYPSKVTQEDLFISLRSAVRSSAVDECKGLTIYSGGDASCQVIYYGRSIHPEYISCSFTLPSSYGKNDSLDAETSTKFALDLTPGEPVTNQFSLAMSSHPGKLPLSPIDIIRLLTPVCSAISGFQSAFPGKTLEKAIVLDAAAESFMGLSNNSVVGYRNNKKLFHQKFIEDTEKTSGLPAWVLKSQKHDIAEDAIQLAARAFSAPRTQS